MLFTSSCGDTSEFDPVEVVRISSQDAKSLIDERRDGKAKLAGVGVKHFGGFFEEAWRRNDIMWGRLDAAEVILDTLLPAGHPRRDDWLVEAQEAIIREELLDADSDAVISTVVRGLLAQQRNTGLRARLGGIVDPNEAVLAGLVESSGTEVKPALQSALTAALTPPGCARSSPTTVSDSTRVSSLARHCTLWAGLPGSSGAYSTAVRRTRRLRSRPPGYCEPGRRSGGWSRLRRPAAGPASSSAIGVR